MIRLPEFSLFDRSAKVPNRHRIEAEHKRGGYTFRVLSNWPRTRWWVTGQKDGLEFRICNNLSTSSAELAKRWIADCKAGHVEIS